MLMRRFGATPLRIVGLPWPSLATSWSRTWRAAARLSKAAGSAFGSASTSIATLSSTSRTTPRARSRAARLLPVLVECGLQAGAGHQGRARSTGHFRQPPPLLTRDQPHRLAQGMSQQIDGVLYPARSPQRAGVQRRPQLPRTEPSGPLGQLDAALYQPAVQVVLDQPPPEADQRALAEGRIPHVEAVQDQLPATVHQRALDGLVIRAAGVRLQDRGQGQLRRRHRRLALRGFRVGGCQLGLELLLEELVPVLAQPHEQLGSTDLLDDRPLGLGQLDGGTPGGGTHVWESASSKCSAHHSTQRPCPADYLTDVLGYPAAGRSSNTGRRSAAPRGSSRMSPACRSERSVPRANRVPPANGPTTSVKNAAAWSWSSSTARTRSLRRPTATVASPAARRLRTQLTLPNVPITQRRPPTSTSATGVVRTWPDLRPRTLRRALGPISGPRRSRRLAIGLNSGTKRGTRSWVAISTRVYTFNQSVAGGAMPSHRSSWRSDWSARSARSAPAAGSVMLVRTAITAAATSSLSRSGRRLPPATACRRSARTVRCQ